MLHKILKLGRFSAVFSVLTLIVYASSVSSLYFKGVTLEQIVKHEMSKETIILLVVAFTGLHLLGSFLRTIIIHWRQWLRTHYFMKYWRHYNLRAMNSDQAEHPERYFQHIVNHWPGLQDSRINIVSQVTGILFVFTIYALKVVQDQLWIALIFIPILGGFSWLAGSFLKERVSKASDHHVQEQNIIMRWCRDYFLGYRERQLNWQNSEQELHLAAGERFLSSWRSRLAVQFGKSMGVFTCIDAPFVLSMGGVIGAAAYGKIGLADVVIWIGLIEYLVEANNSIASVRAQMIQRNVLRNRVESDLSGLEVSDVLSPETESFGEVEQLNVKLLDETEVILKTKPGLYHIRGKNGSGKSTLLNAVLNLNHNYEHWNREELGSFSQAVLGKTRIVERNPVIYSQLTSLATQISGERTTDTKGVLLKFRSNLAKILTPDLVEQWTCDLQSISDSWDSRSAKMLSSGESVVLSFARAAYHWEDVSVLVVDEVESVLDARRQVLFQKTMSQLSQKIAVFYVSHMKRLKPAMRSSIVGTAFAVSHSEKTEVSRVLEMRVACFQPGTGRLRGLGNLGPQMIDDLRVVLRALAHTHPSLEYLSSLDIDIEFDSPGAKMVQSGSARLAIAIALLNTHRVRLGLEPLPGIAATGLVRIDGGIDLVNHAKEKMLAAKQESFVKDIFTPMRTQHLSQVMVRMGIGLEAVG